MATINLTKGGFLRRVYNFEQNPNEWQFLGNKPALIDFHAKWCGPCKKLSPIIDEIAQDYINKVDVYKVDVDEESELSDLFNIRSVPTLVFIGKDKEPQLATGIYPKHEIANAIDNILLK